MTKNSNLPPDKNACFALARIDNGLCTIACPSAFFVGGAGGIGEDLNISGRPVSEGGDLTRAPTLQEIQAIIFNPFCTICH